eukprot:TRINITY_DN7953_c0_g1_i1.p1 TRINITY_DN7953_c0_g1~~TRINITY_DN7953_c0_g1_i1.p1  ORF type:complete len:465 (+),score=83.94 TRINITY_DN7953_c0_g1_i1:63-1457(+)
MSPPAAILDCARVRRRIREPGCEDAGRWGYKWITARGALAEERRGVGEAVALTAVDHVDEFHRWGHGVGAVFDPVPFLNGPFIVSDAEHPEQAVVYVSAGFSVVTGHEGDALMGRSCGELHADAGVARVRDLVKARRAGFAVIRYYCARTGVVRANPMYFAPLTAQTASMSMQGRGYVLMCLCDVTPTPLPLLIAAPTSPFYNTDCTSKVVARGGNAAFSADELVPNAGALHIHNGHIMGQVFLKTRTSPALDPRVASYFEGRRRKFEFQMQFVLSRDVAAERLYLNSFLEKPMQLGFAARGAVRIITALLKKLSRGSQCFFGDETPESSRAAIAIPFVYAADEIVTTPPDEAPPALGVELAYSDSSPQPSAKLSDVKKQLVKEGYRAGWTYTVAFYSMYLDLEEWAACNLPGLRPISLRNFWKDQSLHVGLSVLPEGEDPQMLQARGLDLFDLNVVHRTLSHY